MGAARFRGPRDPLSEAQIRKVIRDEAAQLDAIRIRLFNAGLVGTAQALHEPLRQLGWEGAELLERSARAKGEG